MGNQKKIWIFLIVLIFILFLRDAPYVNLYFIGRVWLLYVLILLVFLFNLFYSFRRNVNIVVILFLLFFSLLLTLLNLTKIAEAVGVIPYLLLWIVVVTKIRSQLK